MNETKKSYITKTFSIKTPEKIDITEEELNSFLRSYYQNKSIKVNERNNPIDLQLKEISLNSNTLLVIQPVKEEFSPEDFEEVLELLDSLYLDKEKTQCLILNKDIELRTLSDIQLKEINLKRIKH